MRKAFISLVICLLVCCLFNSCKRSASSSSNNNGTTVAVGSKTVYVSHKDFEKEISVKQNLIFTFNQDLVGKTHLHKWITDAQLINFEPSVKGSFRWTAPHELMFSPHQGFPASTEFVATFDNAILSYSEDKELRLKQDPISFHTPLLKLKEASAVWKKSANNQSKPVLKSTLLFNSSISPEELAKQLTVTVGGKTTSFQVITSSTVSSGIVIELDEVASFEENEVIKFNVAKGLKLPGGESTSNQELSATIKVPEKDRLIVKSVQPSHDGINGQIYINTNQEIDLNTVQANLIFEPEIVYSVDVSDNGLLVTSDKFSLDQSYELTIKKEMQGILGNGMGSNYSKSFTFGKVQPKISFSDKQAMYLAANGNRNMKVSVINVPEVEVEIIKVFSNNIQAFMKERRDYDWEYDEEYDDYYRYNTYNTHNYGQQVYKETIKTTELPKLGAQRLLNINFEDKLPKYDGIFVVKVSSTEKMWLTDTRIIAISDIALIGKKEKNGVYVFANSIQTAEPLAGVKINFISSDNQTLYTAKTSPNGVAVFDNVSEVAPNFEVAMITAERGEDYNFLKFSKTQINTSRFNVGGLYAGESNYTAFIYGERNMYRPGEDMNIACIVRDLEWDTPYNMPVKLVVRYPNGKEFKSLRQTLNENGAFEVSLPTTPTMMTGSYSVEVLTANDVLLNSQIISVEEFMPDRIKVDIELESEEVILSQNNELVVNLKAMNYFGPPAANRKYEVETSLNRAPFVAKDYPRYKFSNNKTDNIENMFEEGTTDAEGNASMFFKIDSDYENMGLLKGKAFATVFDESGRPVNKVQPFEVYTQDVFYGIGHFDHYVNTRSVLNIPFIAVDKDGVAMNNTEAQIEIVRFRYRTVIEKNDNGYYKYRSEKEEINADTQNIQLGPNGNVYSFVPSINGYYEVRIMPPGSKHYVSRTFYSSGWGETESTAYEVNPEGKIDIELDKEKYNVGETAKVLFKTPFSGKMLVTFEQDRVLQYMILDTDNKSAEIVFPLNNEHLPNLYITATLYKPHINNELPLFVAHGFKNLEVHSPRNQLAVEVDVIEKSRSKTKQTIRIASEPNTELTVAVVDEGILALKDYQSPNPYDYFYQKRGLAVESFDLYPYLYPELVGEQMLLGGDGGMDMGKRVNPLTGKRVKLTRFWSGILNTGPNGQAEYEIDIPQFSGDLRVMAVAYKDNRFGADDANMKVADPIVLATSLPRFLSPDDAIKIPVTVSNTTDRPTNATVQLEADGPIIAGENTSYNIEIPANSEKQVEFTAVADKQIDFSTVKVTVNAMGETFTEEVEMPVRPASSLQKSSGSGAIAGGKSEQVDWASQYVDNSIDGKLVISKSPLYRLGKDLSYLVGYPHGCLEQTISKAFPQMYYTELVKDLAKNGETDMNPAYNVQEAVDKLSGMQLSSGGISYWPSSGSAHWWGSVYALHFLSEADQKGFDVNDEMLKNLQQYVKNRLKTRETYKYYYNRGNSREIAAKEIFYALYVLATMGDPQISTMNYYKTKTENMSLDSKYMLAAAYALAGDSRQFEQILPQAFTGEDADQALSGSFYSHIRDMGISLNCLLVADPDNQQIPILARQLSEEMQVKRYYNTQERIFAFLALGKMAERANAGNSTASIDVNGNTVANFNGETLTIPFNQINAKNFSINVEGNGELYYFWDIEGLSMTNDYEEKDNFIKVRKRLLDRNGNPIDKNNIEQNDLIVVELNLKSLNKKAIENVVISDLLPAGFEIENPRLNQMPGSISSWAESDQEPDHFDVRDDRVHFFTTARKREGGDNYYYVVRAVSKGDFVMGPASADAMYNGEYHSYSGGGKVSIQ